MKNKITKIFALMLALFMLIGTVACSDKKEPDNEANVGNGAIMSPSDDEPSNESDDESEEDEPKDEVAVFENFKSGVVVDEPDNNSIKFEITSIKTTESGIELYYDTSRDGSYTNYFNVLSLKVNGCSVPREFCDKGVSYNSMNETKKGAYDDAEFYILIPQRYLDMLGISEWECIEMNFEAGYEAYDSITSELTQKIALYSGEKTDISYDLPENAGVVLVDNDKCKIVLCGKDYRTSIITKENYGCNYYVYIETKDETILFSPGKITIGDKEFGPVKDSRGYAAGFRIDEGQKTIDYFYWTDNELDVPSDTLAHESCILNYGLTYGAGSESVTETFQVELDLSFAE